MISVVLLDRVEVANVPINGKVSFMPLLTVSTLSPVLLPGAPEVGSLKSPSGSRGPQRYVIEGLSEKSSMVTEPWERLLDILAVVGARCEWQGDKGQRCSTYLLLLRHVTPSL